jgi:predicted nucleotidyltransferase
MPLAEDRSNAVHAALEHFVAVAREALADDLRAAVLFGSAAEDALRATSDVNLILVLVRFDPDRVSAMRDALRAAQAAIGLEVMFLLEAEIDAAAEAFAVKFFDVQHRRKVLWGGDPFASLAVSSPALSQRLKQVLLNLILRLRHAYATRAAREEHLPALIADAVGPLRASAATLLVLRGYPAEAPKAALARVLSGWNDDTLAAVPDKLSALRDGGALAPGDGEALLLAMIAILERMRAELAT